jgi:hypothetical protein
MRPVNPLDHGFRDPKGAVATPAETAAGRFDDKDARLVFE